MSLRAAVEDIAGQLTAAGLPATGDPSKARAGMAVLFPTRIEYASYSPDHYHLTLDVALIGNNRDSTLVVIDTLSDALTVLRETFEVFEADAVTLDIAGTSYPVLLAPLTVEVTP